MAETMKDDEIQRLKTKVESLEIMITTLISYLHMELGTHNAQALLINYNKRLEKKL